MRLLKITELINLCKKFEKFVKLRSCKNLLLKVNRARIFFIWVRNKSRKAELNKEFHLAKNNLAKCGGMFRHDCSYKIRFIYTNTKARILEFQIMKTFQTLH